MTVHALTRAIVVGAVIAVAGTVWWAHSRRAAGAPAEQDDAVSPPNRLRPIGGRSGDEAAVALDLAAQRRIGIGTRVLAPSSASEYVRLAGELVADPARVAVVQAPLAGRLIASGHWPALGEYVDAGTVLGQVSDARPLVAPRGGTVSRVAAQPGEIVQAGQELLELRDFSRPLARVVWDGDAPPAPPRSLAVRTLGEAAGESRASLVGLAPAVDSLTRRPVYLFRLDRSWPGARPGAPIVALVPGERASAGGILVPAEAVVQWQGLAWAYVEREPGAFVRVRIDTSHPVPGGWLVTSGVRAGDRMVVEGAELLLSEEFRSRVSVGEDEDKR
jgi:biotin carboxyl carrier protein